MFWSSLVYQQVTIIGSVKDWSRLSTCCVFETDTALVWGEDVILFVRQQPGQTGSVKTSYQSVLERLWINHLVKLLACAICVFQFLPESN